MKSTSEVKNYGLSFSDTPDLGAYVLGGATSLPKEILRPNGDWSQFMPKYEAQAEKFETWGCTVFGTLNAVEALAELVTGKKYDFSERYIYNLAEIGPGGTDPHKVCEIVRNEGLIDQELLPMTDTYEEFCKPRPMEAQYEVKGQLFPYTIGHEYVFRFEFDKTYRTEKIREALKYSPLGVSVTAWFKDENGLYVDNGLPNNHWCVLYGETKNGWKIFDTYDGGHKILSFDHQIQVCKRFSFTKKPKKKNWLVEFPGVKKITEILEELVRLIKQ